MKPQKIKYLFLFFLITMTAIEIIFINQYSKKNLKTKVKDDEKQSVLENFGTITEPYKMIKKVTTYEVFGLFEAYWLIVALIVIFIAKKTIIVINYIIKNGQFIILADKIRKIFFAK